MLVDAVMNFITFLASIGISGIQNLGSSCSIVTAILSEYPTFLYFFTRSYEYLL